MLEREIERKCVRIAKARDMLAWKFTSPGTAGVPDRVFVTSRGTVFFVEFKKPGGRVSPIQQRQIDRLDSRGVPVFVVYSVEEFTDVLETVETLPGNGG